MRPRKGPRNIECRAVGKPPTHTEREVVAVGFVGAIEDSTLLIVLRSVAIEGRAVVAVTSPNIEVCHGQHLKAYAEVVGTTQIVCHIVGESLTQTPRMHLHAVVPHPIVVHREDGPVGEGQRGTQKQFAGRGVGVGVGVSSLAFFVSIDVFNISFLFNDKAEENCKKYIPGGVI